MRKDIKAMYLKKLASISDSKLYIYAPNYYNFIYKYMVKYLYIMRGLPSSGKSFWVEQFIQNLKTLSYDPVLVASADDYFIRPDGIYDFNPNLLFNAHKKCKEDVLTGMLNNTQFIIIDNTNIKRKDFKYYIKIANRHNYNVVEKVIGGYDEESIQLSLKRNKHNVPEKTIRKMATDLKNSLESKTWNGL